ncbi:hypothetical protein EMPS_06625 [Entomortierella parvispora]|uniref:Galactose oxidase n=1 Tax=Entomortierella parvispora TaxID=205924 RepID=A0A9P3HDB9_9FUNG|nr:hypothetical protein EMPS_06625 [Entomortierella parvispora]
MIPLALAVLLSATCTLLLGHVDAQTATTYIPVAYSAAATLADGAFYMYGGVIKFDDSPTGFNTGTNQFLRLDLTKSFSTTSPPWTSIPGNLIFTMIDAAPSQIGQQFIICGNRDYIGQPLCGSYDIGTKGWVTLPNTNSTPNPTYKRYNIGMTLDKSTGLVVVYGGLGYAGFLQEISALDTYTNPDPTKYQWDISFNQTVIPALYAPFVLYLPTLKKTLVIGGGDRLNATTGYVARAASLATGYLISGETSQSTTDIQTQPLTFAGGLANPPPPRYQACKVVMDDGNVLIQGGRDPTLFYGDTWVLNVTTWVWTNMTVNGPASSLTRAGHACTMGPNGQLLIVGGFVMPAGVSTYVNPAVIILNTKTWTVTDTYNGAAVDQIWTPGPTPGSTPTGTGGNNDNSSSKTSSGLSSGAKGGIGACVVLILVGIVGFVFWKKRTGRDKTARHYNQPHAASTEKNYTGGDDPSAGSGGLGSVSGGSGAGMSPISLHSQLAQHVPPVTGSPLSTAALSTATPSSTGPAISYATKPQQLPAGGKFGGYFVRSQAGSKVSDEDLASAMVQAEDKVASSPHQSPTVHHISSSALSSPLISQDVYAAGKMGQGSPNTTAGTLSPQTIARNPVLTSGTLSSTDAFLNANNNVNAPHRMLLNPQSVPEHEARIERTSPGVRTHVIHSAEDLDAQGLYPPLTADRLYGFGSTIIGTPAPHPNQTAASSFSAAAAAAVADAANTPTEAQAQRASYFGQQQQPSPYMDANQQQQQQQYQPPPQQYGAPQTSPYRDPRMMRDLDDIARMIENQTMSEPQGPHTVQHS